MTKLESLRKEFGHLNITIYHGDCNKILGEQIFPQLSGATQKRAVAFIDPFGMNMSWETMTELAKLKTVEAFINVPVMGINRSVLKKNPKAISEQDKERMRCFWGDDDWIRMFYKDETTLFGPERVKLPLRGLELGNHYRKRLTTVFPYCTEPVLMTNSKGAPLYCILFAGHNATGIKIAGDIFRKYAKEK